MQKFLRTLTLLALLAVPWVSWGQTSVLIGDTANVTDDTYLPMNSLYNYSYSQQIYTAEEIGMAGNITSITLWLKGNANLYTMPFDIYMLEVDNASFTSNTDWIPVTTADIVYSGSITVHNTDYQAYTFDLTTPFTYSGTGNLVICFDNNTGQWKGGLNGIVNLTEDGSIKAIYARQDGADYDPLNMTGITATGTLAKRNVIQLDITPAGGTICEKPATLSVVELSAHEVTIAWASTSAGSYEFEFKAATDTEWELMTPANYPGTSIIIPNLQSNTAYNARVRSVCGTDYSGYKTLNFTTPPSCFAVTNVTVSNITLTSAVLNWVDSINSGATYTIMLDTMVVDVTEAGATSYQLTDLEVGTQYSGYTIVANCSDEDHAAAATVPSFSTAYGVPFIESFATTSIPANWTRLSGLVSDAFQGTLPTTATSGWNFGSSNGFTDNHARVNIYGTNCKYWLVTPEIDLNTDEDIQLTFEVALTAYSGTMAAPATNGLDDKFMVLISTDGGATWSANNATTWLPEGGNYNYYDLPYNSYAEYAINLNAYRGGSVKIAFYGESTESNADNNLHIDNVSINVIPDCNRPGNIVVDEVTGHTATIHWTAGGSETSWNVYLDNELMESVTDTFYTFTSLAPETTFAVAVTSDCGGGESDARTASFTTLVACPAPTGLAAFMTPGDGTTATIAWVEAGEATEWQICFNEDSTNYIDVYDSSYTFTDLTPEQTYTVKVRAICGGEDGVSAWSDILSFQPSTKTVIGSGSATNGYLPTYTYYNYSLTQQIYTAAELGDASAITSIDYFCSGDRTRTLDIYMVSTTKQSFADGFDWIPVTTSDLVFSGSVDFVANAWTTITLDDPFAYDGTNNVAIIVDDNTGSYVSAPTFRVFDATSQALRIYSDGTNYDPFAPSSYSGSVMNVKNQIRLVMGDAPTCVRPTELTVSDVTANSVTLSWTDEANSGATYTVYEVNATGATQIATGINTTTYTVTGLDAQTGYTFGVEANCSATDASTMATVSATTECEGGSCNIYIYAQDSYGDGWNNASVAVMQGNATVSTYTMAGQGVSSTTIYDTATISVCAGAPISFSWTSGQWDDEITLGIANANGEVVYSAAGSDMFSGETFFTMESCTAEAPVPDTVTITFAVNDASMGTTNPAPGTYQYTVGSTISITAIPNSGYVLAGWIASFAMDGITVNDTLASDNELFSNPVEIYIVSELVYYENITFTALFEAGTPDTTQPVECTVTLPYVESFDNGLGCWSTVNGSSDGSPWNAQAAFSNGSITPHTGAGMVASWSWNSGAMHANAWLISPMITLPAATAGDSLTLSWWHRVNANYPTELYDVKLSTTTADTASFTTTLLAVSPDSTGDWVMNHVNLNAYAGQNIYIAFHHHDSYDQNYLLIDDIALNEGAPYVPEPDSVIITLAVNDATMGTTSPAPGTYHYALDTVVALSATANAGYHFLEWSVSYLSNGVPATQTFFDNPIYFNASNLFNFSPLTFTAVFEEDLDCTGNTCDLVIEGSDSFGDGWDNGILKIMQNNVLVSTFVVDSTVATANVTVCSDYPVEFTWMSSSYNNEVSFNVSTSTGTQLFAINGAGSLNSGNVFATVTNPCTSPVVTFNHDSVAITIAINDATMGTVTPAPGTYQYLDSDTLFIDATANTGAHFVEWQLTYVYDGALETISISGASHGYLCSGLIGYQNLTFTAIFESDTISTLPIECTGNTCFVTIEGMDEYGDGWNGNELLMYQHDTLIATFTLDGVEDASYSQTYAVCSAYPVEFAWSEGLYSDEVSFTVSNSNGVLFNITNGSVLEDGAVFATVSNVCDANASVVLDVDVDTLTVTLAVNNATMGTITPAPGTYQISELESLTVVATPNTGYNFTGWAYSYTINDTVYYDTASYADLDTLEIEGWYWAEATPVSFTALFSDQEYVGDSMLVNIAVNDPTMGTTNPAPGAHYFHEGEVVSVVALPNDGYHIAGWDIQLMLPGYGYLIDTTVMYALDDIFSLWADEDGPLTVTEDMVEYVWSVTAIFEAGEPVQAIDSVTVITAVNDATMGTITPAPGTHYYTDGDVVNLEITPNEGYYLYGVSYSISHPLYGVLVDTMITDVDEIDELLSEPIEIDEEMYGFVFSFTAIFAPEGQTPQYTVSVDYDNAMGTVTGAGTFDAGSTVTLTATANSGYEFVAWVENGDTVATTTTYTINNLNADHSLTAIFQVKTGINDVELDDVTITSTENLIVVRGAEGRQVVLFDINGRMMSREAKAAEEVTFRVSSTGVYLVKVGNAPAKRVVVMR